MNPYQEVEFQTIKPLTTDQQIRFCSTCRKFRNHPNEFIWKEKIRKTCHHCRGKPTQTSEYHINWKLNIETNKEQNIRNQPWKQQCSRCKSWRTKEEFGQRLEGILYRICKKCRNYSKEKGHNSREYQIAKQIEKA